MRASLDRSTVDLTRTRIKLRADITFRPQTYDGKTWYHIEVAAKSQYYRIGFTEYVFVSLLDGNTTFCEALALTARAQGAEALPRQQALTLYTWLLENEIAVFSDKDVPEWSAAKKPQGLSGILPKVNPFWIRLPFGRPEEMLKVVQPFLGWLFSPVVTVAGIAFMVAAVLRVTADWDRYEAASSAVFAPANWLWMLVAWILLKTIHELAHGMTCQRYGGQVRETGVILAFFAPLAYVDVTDCWGFSSKWQRIHTAAAGMYVELLLAAAAVFAWPHVSSDVASHLLYNVIVMASVSTILFNANPLMRFDGYYILSDLLEIPNLYTQSSQAVRQLWDRILFGSTGTAPVITGSQLRLLQLYGIAAFGWRMLICSTMMIAASVLFHGAGVLLSVLGVVAWFAIPLGQMIRQIVVVSRTAPVRLVRAGIVAAVVVSLGASAFLIPVPFGTVAPGVVSLHEGCVVRSKSSGFINAIHVHNGQAVSKGDLLITLKNDDVTSDFADLELQVRQENIRRQMAMQEHDAAQVAVSEGNLKSLQEQLAELAEQVKALSIHARTDGFILTRELEVRQGTYIQEGEEILVIDDRKPRELHISISQEDFPAAGRQVDHKVHVRLGTRPALIGQLTRVIPRASRQLSSPALAATNGGSLAVSAADDQSEEDVELTEPRFKAVVELTELTNDLPVGERGYASLGRVEKSIGLHLYDQASGWLKNQIDVATRQSRM